MIVTPEKPEAYLEMDRKDSVIHSKSGKKETITISVLGTFVISVS